jgi:predicted O-linked N-acetylglucosamine transferase (SPINDLY family)
LRNRIDDWEMSDLRLQDLAWSNFYLAYHGEDDLPLQRAYAQLLQDLAARVWPAWQQAPQCGHPRRVVLLSSFWRNCTVGVYFAGWIDWLREAGFEVVIYQLGPQRDAMTDALFSRASRGVFWESRVAWRRWSTPFAMSRRPC